MGATDTLRVELRPDGDGTALTLVDTFGELGKAARDGAGWHECLGRGSRQPGRRASTSRGWGEAWKEIHPLYVERFGPEASTIGPPEGWDALPACTDVPGAVSRLR